MVEGASAGELEFKVARRVRENYLSFAMQHHPLTDGKGTLWLLIGPSGAGKTTIQHKLESMVSYLTVIEPYTDRQLRVHEVQAILASIRGYAEEAAAKRVLNNPREMAELLDDPRVVSHTRFRTPQTLDLLISEAGMSSITWPADAADKLPQQADYGEDAIGRHFVKRATIDYSLKRGDVLIPTTNPIGIGNLLDNYPNARIVYIKADNMHKVLRGQMKRQGRSPQEAKARFKLNSNWMKSYEGFASRHGIVVKNPGLSEEELPELPERISFVASKVAYAMTWVRQHPGLSALQMHELFADNIQSVYASLKFPEPSGEGQLTAGDVIKFPSDIVGEYNKLRHEVWEESEDSEGLKEPVDLPSSVKLRVSEVKDLTSSGWTKGGYMGVRSIVLQPMDSGYRGADLGIALADLNNFYLAKWHGILNRNPMQCPSDLLVQDFALSDYKPHGHATYALRVRFTDP